MKNSLILALFLLSWTPVVHRTYTVKRIIDGDTIVLSNGSHIRLAEIDAPEKSQPFGDSSKIFTVNYLLGKEIRLVKKGKDRYGRTLGKIYLMDGTYFNELSVRKGFSWFVPAFSSSRILAHDMAIAQHDSIGLWLHPPYISPNDWRKSH